MADRTKFQVPSYNNYTVGFTQRNADFYQSYVGITRANTDALERINDSATEPPRKESVM